MSHLSVFRIFWKPFFYVFSIKIGYFVVSKKNNPLYVWGWDRKFRPSRLPFVITRQASWCQSVILGTDFSIPPSHSWWILIMLHSSLDGLTHLSTSTICIQLTTLELSCGMAHRRAIKEDTIARNHDLDLHPGMQTVALYPCYIPLYMLYPTHI